MHVLSTKDSDTCQRTSIQTQRIFEAEKEKGFKLNEYSRLKSHESRFESIPEQAITFVLALRPIGAVAWGSPSQIFTTPCRGPGRACAEHQGKITDGWRDVVLGPGRALSLASTGSPLSRPSASDPDAKPEVGPWRVAQAQAGLRVGSSVWDESVS